MFLKSAGQKIYLELKLIKFTMMSTFRRFVSIQRLVRTVKLNKAIEKRGVRYADKRLGNRATKMKFLELKVFLSITSVSRYVYNA
jgi:hypothetical protein